MVELGTLPRSDLTIDKARSRLAGWHFSQESLTASEREILHVAEAVLAELDRLYGGYARVVLDDAAAARVSALIDRLTRPAPIP
jgi:hypothetical protein